MRAPSACLPSLVLLLSVAWSEARAQAPAWGPWIGYEAGVPWDLNRRPGAVDWCNCDGSGRASEQVLSAGMALRWPDALGRAWGLSAGAGALLRIGVFRSDPYVTAPFADPSSGAIVSSRAEFEARTRGGDLFAEASLSFSPFGRFELHAGPWTAWRIAGSWSLRERFLDVLPAAGADLQPQSIDGGRLAAPRWTGGAFIAARQLLPLSGDAALELGAGLRLHAGLASDGLGLRALHAACSVSLLWGDWNEAPPPALDLPMYVPVPRSTPPAAAPLEASLELYSTGSNGERIPFGVIRPVQQYHRLKTALRPALYFARNSAQIPERYAQLTPSAHGDFNDRNLIGMNPVEIDRQLLNILGMRLTELPATVLTITGSASADEPAAMALARAEAVQLYLRTVWDIPASRLRTAVAPPQGGNPPQARRVECSGPPELLEPVIVEWMVEQYQTTPVGLDPAISTTAGVRDWAISITQGSDTVAYYSSRFPERNRELDVRLLLRDTQDGSPVAPLVAALAVTDSAGRAASARDILDFKYASDLYPDVTKVHVRSERVYTLPGGDLWTSAEGGAGRQLVREIAESAQDGDVLTVAPLLPFTGAAVDAERARASDLQHISNALLIELGKKRVDIRIAHASIVPGFDAALPEYARYARTVVVTAARDRD